MDDLSRNVFCLGGMPIDILDLARAEAEIMAAIQQGERCFVSTPNLNFLAACQRDATFRDAVVLSDLSLADGQPLVWLAKLLGASLTERVAGSTLFDMMSKGTGVDGRKIGVFFFGGMEGVAEQACLALNASSTGMHCVGYEYPGFGSVEDMSTDAIIQRINASGADFLVVSLGAAKGQEWIMRNRDTLAVPVISHLGAVVDFVAGSVQRAPRWMQAAGLEWLWRIKEDPALRRRYWRDGIAILGLLLTRLLPYRLAQLLDIAGHSSVRADLQPRAKGARIVLSGALDKEAIVTLRPVFRRGLGLVLRELYAKVGELRALAGE